MLKKIALSTTLLAIALICTYTYAFKKSKPNEAIIADIMAYQMPDVITRCQKDHHYSDEDMVILEQELKRYLILAIVKTDIPGGSGMYSTDVDNLWHSFILFTKEYADFCNLHARHFIHHAPETDFNKTPEKLAETRADFQAFIKNYELTFNEEIHPIWLLDMCENMEV